MSTAEALRELKTSLDRIENKLDHEQAMNALRLGKLLSDRDESEAFAPDSE